MVSWQPDHHRSQMLLTGRSGLGQKTPANQEFWYNAGTGSREAWYCTGGAISMGFDPSPYDQKIAELTQQADVLSTSMEHHCQQFVSSAEYAIIDWCRMTVERSVIASPSVTHALGTERLHAMKSELARLLEDLPSSIQTALGADQLWAHRIGDYASIHYESSDYWPSESRHSASPILRAVQGTLGPVGTILLQYGYLNTRRSRDWGETGNREGVLYLGNFPWTPAMKTAVENYRTDYEKFFALCAGIRTTQEEKARAGARSLWDNA